MPQAARTAILLLILTALAIPLAGQTENLIYAHLSYMKVIPGHASEYVRSEREMWKPIHEARLRAGIITGWQLYRVEFPSGRDAAYDYVVVTNFNDIRKMPDSFPMSVYEAAHPGADAARVRMIDDEAEALRQVVRRELWVRREALDAINPAYSLLLTKTRVAPGADSDYLGLERSFWKPIHQAAQDAGASAGWSVWELLFPGGSREPYNFLTVSFYNTEQEAGRRLTEDMVRSAHPNITPARWEEMNERTHELREEVVRELWSRIEQTTGN